MPNLHKTVRCKPSTRTRKLDPITKQLTFNHTATTPLSTFLLSRNREDFFIDTYSQLDTMPRIR
jgi:hypothetical protein